MQKGRKITVTYKAVLRMSQTAICSRERRSAQEDRKSFGGWGVWVRERKRLKGRCTSDAHLTKTDTHTLTFKIWPIWIKRQISGWKINTVYFISTTCPSVSAESHLCCIKDTVLLLGLFIQPTQRPLKAKNLSRGFQAATEEDAIPVNCVAWSC